MKLKIKKTNDELIVDFSAIRDPHDFRCSLLKYIIDSKKNVIILIDTNICIRKLPIDDITNYLKINNIEYNIVPTKKNERILFGISGVFGKKKKPEISESILILMVSREHLIKKIYNDFLMYYDYGVMTGVKIPLDEILDLYRLDYSEVMFNKEVAETCYYDSIIFTSMRSNLNDEESENCIRGLVT